MEILDVFNSVMLAAKDCIVPLLEMLDVFNSVTLAAKDCIVPLLKMLDVFILDVLIMLVLSTIV